MDRTTALSCSRAVLAYAALGNLMEVFFGPQVKYLCGVLAMAIWIIGLALNVLIMAFFTIRHALPFKTDKLLASYYVTYIGIVVACVTAKAYGLEGIGVAAFAFGLLSYLVLLPAVSYRYAKKAPLPAPLRPLIAIYAAPANLLVVGYLSLNLTWSEPLLYVLWGIGVITTLFAWQQIYKLRKSDFYPGFSAFTFPLVIGAVSTVKFNAHLVAADVLLPVVKYFGLLQTTIACLAVVYVTYRYVRFLCVTPTK